MHDTLVYTFNNSTHCAVLVLIGPFWTELISLTSADPTAAAQTV